MREALARVSVNIVTALPSSEFTETFGSCILLFRSVRNSLGKFFFRGRVFIEGLSGMNLSGKFLIVRLYDQFLKPNTFHKIIFFRLFTLMISRMKV